MARENKNHEQRVIQSFGPKFRIDVNGTLMVRREQMFTYYMLLQMIIPHNFKH